MNHVVTKDCKIFFVYLINIANRIGIKNIDA